MKALSLFSGIGGLDIAAHAAGIETVGFCEIEPFAVKVLERRFPGVENHGDITRFTNRTLRELGGSPFHRFKCPADYNGTIDVVHGGFPCQDLSVAGKQKGLEGERSGLWYEMLRVIAECRPRFVLAENVRGAINLALDTVYSGLVDAGYKVYPYVIPASAVGAPHQRERLFVIGVREDTHRGYTEAMENPGCELRQGAEFSGADGVETGNRDADKPERSGGTLWPTPTTDSATDRSAKYAQGGTPLTFAVKLWPTPCANDDNKSPEAHMAMKRRMGRNTITSLQVRIKQEHNGGQLNPAWVEILMGFPIGWTDPDCDEPEPWPGWPAMMGERLWPTHTAGNHYRQGHSAPSEGNGHGKTLGGQCHEILDQYPYEPPRTVTKCADRAKRLKCLGNAVVPQQAFAFFLAIAEMEAL